MLLGRLRSGSRFGVCGGDIGKEVVRILFADDFEVSQRKKERLTDAKGRHALGICTVRGLSPCYPIRLRTYRIVIRLGQSWWCDGVDSYSSQLHHLKEYGFSACDPEEGADHTRLSEALRLLHLQYKSLPNAIALVVLRCRAVFLAFSNWRRFSRSFGCRRARFRLRLWVFGLVILQRLFERVMPSNLEGAVGCSEASVHEKI